MNIIIIQQFNKDYYKEFYSEWLTSRSKYKKWQNLIGLSSVTLGILIYILSETSKTFSYAMLFFGVYLFIEFYSTRKKWLTARLDSKMLNKEVTLIFEEDSIKTKGPFVETIGKWDFYNDAIESEKGLFLVPENGVSIYIQKKSFQNKNDILDIIKKIKR